MIGRAKRVLLRHYLERGVGSAAPQYDNYSTMDNRG